MISSDLCDLPVYIQRSCQSESKIKEAIHSTVWRVCQSSDTAQKTDPRRGHRTMGSQISVLNEHENWWCLERLKGQKSISRLTEVQEGSSVIGNHWRWKNRYCFSGGKWFHSIWLHQRNSVFFYLEINILCGDLFISLISGHFLLTNGPFFYLNF